MIVDRGIVTIPFGMLMPGRHHNLESYSYAYQSSGIADQQSSITHIEWNVQNKIKRIVRAAVNNQGTYDADLEFIYDPLGNRIAKIIKPRDVNGNVMSQFNWLYTLYSRDAQGNILTTYHREFEYSNAQWQDLLSVLSHEIYGSQRLGVARTNQSLVQEMNVSSVISEQFYAGNNAGYQTEQVFDQISYLGDKTMASEYIGENVIGNKSYELSNHLGNILVTISDAKTPKGDAGNNLALSYVPRVISMNDYYPFGMLMPGRNFSQEDYRFGFNGMEGDDELKGDGNSYDFGARMYDSRIGRWVSLDPLEAKYPGLTPYGGMNNNPIIYRDPDGRDWVYYDESGNELNRTKSKWYHFHWITGDKEIVLTNDEIVKGGFFAYVNFHGLGNLHSSIVDVQTGDLYEVRHPVIDGEPVDGKEYKDEDMSWYEGSSEVAKFEGNGDYEFANEDWWNYKVKNEDGSYEDLSPEEVGVTYIWIPNRGAMLDYLNSRVGERLTWSPFNNCKTFCRDALLSGYKDVEDENHLEIKEILEDEDVHPGKWYNEFEENKSVKNPDKE